MDNEFDFNSKDEDLSFAPPDRSNLLAELSEALDVSIDEYSEEEDVVNRLNGDDALMRTKQERLLLGNQITIMRALEFLLEEK